MNLTTQARIQCNCQCNNWATPTIQMADVVVIVPSESDLMVEEKSSCPFHNCQKSFKSSASLKMHITRHHEGKSLTCALDRTTKAYYCPVNGCNRSQRKEGKPFPRLGQLKQHYNTVHKSNSFVCSKCGRGFGLKDALGRHMKECGQTFHCSECNTEFKSRNALYQHNKRSHLKNLTKNTPPTATPLILSPIVIKPVLPIPKKVQKLDSVCQTLRIDQALDTTTQSTFSGLDLATQTDLSCLTADHLFDTADLFGTTNPMLQANTVPSCEFGTQTVTLSDDWSQLIHSPSPTTEPHDLALDDILGPSCMDFGTQTLGTCFLDFGSQTYLVTKEKGSQT